MATKKKAGNKSAAAKNKATSSQRKPKETEAKASQPDDQKTVKNDNGDFDQAKAVTLLKKELQIYKIELNDNIARTDALQQDVNELERKNKALTEDLTVLKAEFESGVTQKVQAIVTSLKNEQKNISLKPETAKRASGETFKATRKDEENITTAAVTKPQSSTSAAKRSKRISSLTFELRQQNKGVLQNQALRSRHPFQIAMNFDIPTGTDTEALTLHSGVYNVTVVAKNADDKAVVASFGDADYLQRGKINYTHTLSVTGLPRGKYLLELSATAPFIDLEQKTLREIVVH